MGVLELLSPAGDWGCLKAAVGEGADAVYFGVGGFNARARAENFKASEIRKVSGFAHDAGAKAYLAANTLVKNQETKAYTQLLEDAYSQGVDAVIIQDLSLAQPIKKSLPDLEVHASTQATVYNRYHKPLLKGVDRVVMPRELTLTQVKDFKKHTSLETEVFIQGALCFSISGQCLMSSLLGGRSGNRGVCAQPCRKKYNHSYHMSTKDLSLTDSIDKIAKADVDCVKIEGRLRSREYVGAATALYRRLIDKGELDEDALTDMMVAFNRDYTQGALMKQKDVVGQDNPGKRGIPLGTLKKDGKITLKHDVWVGDAVGITSKNKSHGDIVRKIKLKGQNVQKAPAGQTVKMQLNAAQGDKIYLTRAVQRRTPPAKIKRRKITVKRLRKKIDLTEPETTEDEHTVLHVKAKNFKDAKTALKAGADRAYVDVFTQEGSWEDVSPYIPRCLPDWNAKNAIDKIKQIKPDAVFCGDLGVAANIGCENLLLDVSANAFNDNSVAFYNKAGLTPVISPELSFTELQAFKDRRFAVFAHGRLPLMTSAYVLEKDSLTDERGYTFPVEKEQDKKVILNSVPHGIYNNVKKLVDAGIRQYLISCPDDIAKTVKDYKNILAGKKVKPPRGYTLGRY